MSYATRGGFRAIEQPYIQDVDDEVDTLDRQVDACHPVMDMATLRKIEWLSERLLN